MRVRRVLATTTWLLVATVGLVRLWNANLDVVPRLPVGFWIWLSSIAGVQNGEDLGRLEVIFMLVVSYFVASICTLAGWFIVRKLHHSSPS